MSLNDRLGRLLFIVPYVADRDGVPLAELAQLLDVTPKQIEADLDLLGMVGQPPLTPDHLIDLYVEDDVVYVDLDQSLTRPPRLTHTEARSLVLGAKLVGDLGGLGEQLARVLDKIVAHLNPDDQNTVRSMSERIGVWRDDQDALGPQRALRRAVDEHLTVEMQYYSASSDRRKTYRLHPLALLSHSGVEYLVALDVDADGQEKLFRLDRLGEVHVTGERFTPPDALDLDKYRTKNLYLGNDTADVEVWFAPEAAARVAERFAEREVTRQPDGSVRVRLSTSSAAWLARWVLPFGTQAEVLGPPLYREHLAKLCSDAVAAYRKPPAR